MTKALLLVVLVATVYAGMQAEVDYEPVVRGCCWGGPNGKCSMNLRTCKRKRHRRAEHGTWAQWLIRELQGFGTCSDGGQPCTESSACRLGVCLFPSADYIPVLP